MWNDNERYERRSSGGGGGGGIISRLFGSKRRSLPALEELDEKQLAEDLRRHVWAVAIAGNEHPMPVINREFPSQRYSADLGYVPACFPCSISPPKSCIMLSRKPVTLHVCPGRSFLRELAGCTCTFGPPNLVPYGYGIGESGP